MYKLQNIFILLLFFFVSSEIEAQCAMCKAVVESGEGTMAEGVNSGITYLMVFPYILVGLLLYFIYRYKKTSKN